MKDNKVLGIILGVVVLLLVGGGIFFLTNRNSGAEEASDEMVDESIPKLSKEDLGLGMEISPDKKQVKFSMTKAGDIKKVEYEITYDADSEEDESVKVPKGITGEEQVNGNSFETKYLVLGTCSKNVCKYDTGLEEVKLIVKITKKDGKVYQAEDVLAIKGS